MQALYQEKVEVDRAHIEKTSIIHHNSSARMEPSGEKKEGKTKALLEEGCQERSRQCQHLMARARSTWTLGGCYHDPISETDVRTTTWLVSGSAPHQKLAAIILNKRWLKTAHKFLRFRLTSHLESFQNHILMYASKRFAFSPDVYGARCLLAAIDYNRHKDRPVAKRKRDGEVMYVDVFSLLI
ncbi:Hypp8119 [Branchiostoma lanceolatum]|uniref:Hypp8119 protein n=1 Tax=Branchiostoma lanceolatum TaxID=7740 RepID=A0A8J9Z624_BRALA|nr:Hypp8119 [Branchiostoma lanceolatum]